MLEYCKLILQKVSFNEILFKKELMKSVSYLLPEETEELIRWAEQSFSDRYPEIISLIQDFLNK